jgi:Mitochondrial ribosomal protein (VAR1)
MMTTYKIKNQNFESKFKLNFTQLTSKNLREYQPLNYNLNMQNLSIDSRILPLFRTPLLKKKSEEIQVDVNQYNLNTQNNFNPNFSNQILKVFLKGITLYNLNLKNFLLQGNKLNLILNIKNDKLYELNTRISNFFHRVNKLNFEFNEKTVSTNNSSKTIIKKNDTLFARPVNNDISHYPNLLGRNITKEYGFRKLLIIQKISKEKVGTDIENNKELIEFGKEIINDLNYQISQNKTLINKIIKNKKVLDFLKNTSLLSLNNNNLNYNPINSNLIVNEQLSPINIPISGARTEEFNHKNLLLNKLFNSINKSNEIKIEDTINSILKIKEFDYKTDSISMNSNFIPVVYNNKSVLEGNIISKSPIINDYLKAISKFNIINKGISVHYSNIIGFNFNSKINKLYKNIYNLLVYSFKSMFCLISKPIFVITPNKIIIQLFYYLFIPNVFKSKKIYKFGDKRRNNLRIYLTWKKRRNKIKKLYRKLRKININSRINLRKLYFYNITQIFPNKFKNLCEILNKLFKKPVELDLIRLHYPYNDSNILANFLAIMINRIKLRIIVKRLFNNAILKNKKFSSTKTNKLNIIPAFLSGINIKVAGRLLNNRIVPRKTVKTIRRGAIAKGKINYLDVARYTNKNKRGAYSITVSTGQNYF